MHTLITRIIVRPILYVMLAIRENKKLRDSTIHSVLWDRAINESADYASKYLSEVLIFKKNSEIWDYTIHNIIESSPGMVLEFGCYSGTSVNYFARRLPNFQIFGFDSFEGLPEDWFGHHAAKGAFDRQGRLPNVLKNVELVSGWFEDSLPGFFSDLSDQKVSLVHIDSDTYKSANFVLSHLKAHMYPGMLILFDEYLGYPNWRNGEFLAWQQFCIAHLIKYKYKAFSCEQALIEIISIGSPDY